eukprot:Tbor_TRINITY_DN3153_c0_g1::TRINITY_DN3153_c0_g1_i1::g.14709::m.14709
MLGGGGEFFQPPEHIPCESLVAFARFASALKDTAAKEAAKRGTIKKLGDLAISIGTSEVHTELVIGCIFRHIKTVNNYNLISSSVTTPTSSINVVNKKMLGLWYLLDHLFRVSKDRYAHTASMYITEVGECIPWEDKEVSDKFKALIENWRGLFHEHLLHALWSTKEHRMRRVNDPIKYENEMLEEENVWRHEELIQKEEDGLNEYGQPCTDYLQGKCTWGNSCKQLHPPGQEGTLPPECRLGDWKCVCGIINRHFRRRCSGCPKEKPQYCRSAQLAPEDALLSNPDDFSNVFTYQFGYDPYIEDEAKKYWGRVLAPYSTKQWILERSEAYRNTILPKIAADKMSYDLITGKSGQNTDLLDRVMQREGDAKKQRMRLSVKLNWPAQVKEVISHIQEEPVTKRLRAESGISRTVEASQKREAAVLAELNKIRVLVPSLPEHMNPVERVSHMITVVLNRGASDKHLATMLFVLCKSLEQVCSEEEGEDVANSLKHNLSLQHRLSRVDGLDRLIAVSSLIYNAYNKQQFSASSSPIIPTAKAFFTELQKYIGTVQRGTENSAGVVHEAEEDTNDVPLAMFGAQNICLLREMTRAVLY